MIILIIYIVEDTLCCVNNGKLITVILKNCIQKGFIINSEIFILEFNKMMKKEKIKSKLFGDNISFVNNGYFSIGDIYFIESIFKELGFLKVEFLNIRDLLPTMKAIYVEVNNSYMVLYLDDILYFDMAYFNDIPKTLSLFKAYLDKDVAFFGQNKCIPKVSISNVNCYYIENYVNYITQSLLKVKK